MQERVDKGRGRGKVMVVVAVCWETKSNIQGFEFQNLIC